ncbi:MAG: DUF5011 domain-containing protein, partial [Desulfobacterales bacterium]|nr:DUF5011 domain-containing protein [Desulfobacterales bacterium]
RSVHVVDTRLPVITLVGDSDVTIEVGATYEDAGATAADNYDGDLSPNIVTTSDVNANVVGTYHVTYDVSDGSGNAAAQVVRSVHVVDTTPPDAPTLDPVTSPTNVSPQTISGTKEANTSVWLNESEIVALDADTTWSYELSLNEGTNNISLTSKDAVSNESGATTGSIVLDMVAPAAPLIVSDGGMGPGNDYTTNSSSVTLSGTCTSDTVAIYVNGSTEGVTHTPGETTWTYAGVLSPGVNTFNVEAYDEAGNISASDEIQVTFALPPGVYYVDANGTDEISYGTSSGTGAWNSLHYAIDVINSGSAGAYTLNVADGTYSVANGEDDSDLVIRRGNVILLAGTSAILDGTDASTWTTGIEIEADHVTIDGLRFEEFDTAIHSDGVDGLTVRNNQIIGTEFIPSGICLISSLDFEITENDIEADYGKAIEISGGSGSITRNHIYALGEVVGDEGIYIDGASPLVENNLIRRFDYGIYAENSSPVITNNTIVENATGIEDVSSESTTIKYNIIAYNTTGVDGGAGTTLDYNDFWNNVINRDGGCNPGAGDIFQDPEFVSTTPGTENYHLQPISPCLDATDRTDAGVDLDGITRPQYTAWEMGAYEFEALDTDSDGLPDYVEASIDTDPDVADTDGDGLNDGEEVHTYGTDPNSLDSDGDGLEDGEEITVYNTDPSNPDTDDDGINDGDEVAAGTDPNDTRPTLQIASGSMIYVEPGPLYAMPGRACSLMLLGEDDKTGCTELIFALVGTSNPPEGMTISQGDCTSEIRWVPAAEDAGYTLTNIQTEVFDNAFQASDPVSFDVCVLEPLVIQPYVRVLLRTNSVDVDEEFIIAGGLPHSSTSYYLYELIDADAEPYTVEDSGTISDDGAGNFHYTFSTVGRSGTYRLRIMDGLGFTTVSGPIVIRDVTITPVAMDDTSPIDTATGDTRSVQDTGTVYNGATINIPAESSEAEAFTLTFKLVTEGQPYTSTTAAFGDVVELKAEAEGEEITFTRAIEVTLPYGNIPGIDRPEDLRVYTFDPDLGRWVPVSNYSVDTVNETITFRVTHFSLYTVAQPEELSRPISGGTFTEDYRIISFPCHPDESDLVANLASTLGGYNDTMWRCFAFNKSTLGYDEANDTGFASTYPLEPGNAYWLISRETRSLKVNGLGLDPTASFEATLHPGWNMVANPYDHAIDLDNTYIKVSADGVIFEDISTTALTDNYLFKFHPREVEGTTVWYSKISPDTASSDPPYESMQPYEGYWLYSYSSSDVIIRFEPKIFVLNQTNEPPLFNRMIWLARRSVHRLMNTVSAICFADSGGGNQPPPPPSNPGTSSSSVGTTSSAGGGGGCFIATAAYGSVIHPYVKILKEFRDVYLLTHEAGKKFVVFYYRYSNSIAELIAEHAPLRYITRILIFPLIAFSAFMLCTGAVTKLFVVLILMLGTGWIIWRGFHLNVTPPDSAAHKGPRPSQSCRRY